MDDREMIQRIQKGEKEYLNTIALKYYDDIYRFICYQTGRQEDSCDLTQETFLKFIQYVDSYRYQNLKGYLLTIAMNTCRDYFRKCGRNLERVAEHPEAVFVYKDGIAHKERKLTLIKSLAMLPDIQREAVVLHFAFGYKYREIAKMTGVSVSAVKSRVNQGIEKLKKILSKEDFYE